MDTKKPDWVDPTHYSCGICGTKIDGSQGACKPCAIIVSVILGAIVIGILIGALSCIIDIPIAAMRFFLITASCS